jgi:cytoskeletal protein RodZ
MREERRNGGERGAGKVGLVLFLLLVVAGGVGYWWLQRQQQNEIQAVQTSADKRIAVAKKADEATAKDLAEDIARSLAATLPAAVARGETGALQSQLGLIVQGHRVTAIMVLDVAGKVLATTDLRWVGRAPDDPAAQRAMRVDKVTVQPGTTSSGEVEVDAPLLAGLERVGTLRVFVDLGAPGRTKPDTSAE